ncbi:LPXTG cell wall anchor domain-containing protein [Enterococcus sp. DIV1420a]|uniref:LPXTG cell wall anchor domain-containing protein n=1 Tax=Enterococcus sp. DIV1420a TaxID=2774672 RepID=UPI003F208BA7
MKKQCMGVGILLTMGMLFLFTSPAYAVETVETGQVIVSYQVEESTEEQFPKAVKEKQSLEQSTKMASSQGAESKSFERSISPRKAVSVKKFPQTNEIRAILVSFLGTFLIILVGILYWRKSAKQNNKVEI